MLMGKFHGAQTISERRAAGLPFSLPRPSDFAEKLVEIGRVGCEEHFRVGREKINQWMDECGKDDLIARRAEFVRERQDRERQLRLVAQVVARAFPINDDRRVSFSVARLAAHFLQREAWRVSPAGNGDWRLGLKVVSAAQLVDFAVRKGFDPASLTGRGG